MIGIYIGVFIFIVGSILTLIINRNVKVPIGGDFWDMPLRIKIGIFMILIGVIIFCISTLFMLVYSPFELLNK